MAVVSRPRPAEVALPRSWEQRALGRDWRLAWLFLLPLVAVLLGLISYPFVSAIVLSMQHKVIGGPATWVGLGNYRDLLVGKQYSEVFRASVWVSFFYTAVSVAIKLVLGMCMALLLNERFRGRMLMRGIVHCTVPKMVANATSLASRPVPMRRSPMRGEIPDGSKMYQRSPRYTST